MRKSLGRLLSALAFAVAAHGVEASITCTVSSPGFSAAYSPTGPATNITQTQFTVTCNRTLVTDPSSVTYTVAADNGLNPQGIHNRAKSGSSLINYDDFRDGACSLQWRSGANAITDSMPLPAVGFFSKSTTFWGCIPASQTGLPAGTYTDTVTMTLTGAGTNTNTFPVSIATPATCTISAAPGDIVFNYVAYGPALTPSSTFGATCTNSLPYTMALDITSGTLLNLSYTLALSAASSTGTGAQQNFSINGAMPAGQAGTCASGSCTSTQAVTLTITY
jgi:spore coat protein U-like protein